MESSFLGKNSIFKQIPDKRVRYSLIYSIFDGMLWSLMFGFAENYMEPFALLFGATAFHISLIKGITQLSISFAQLSGAKIIQHFKKRRVFTLVCVFFHAVTWIGLYFATVVTRNVIFILIFFSLGLFITNLAGPGWISWMNDLVPADIRGAYWGYRNKIAGIVQFAAISIAGVFLYFSREYGFEQLAFGILFISGAVARLSGVLPLFKKYEPEMSVNKSRSEFKFRVFLTKLRTTNFGKFTVFILFMTFAVNIMAPIVPVHILKSLKLNYLEYTFIMMSFMVFSFIAMSYWGQLTDKYGNYRILTASALCMPVAAAGWLFLNNVYVLIPLQIFAGFAWAGFNLSSINFIFDSVKRENMHKIMAYYFTLLNFAAFSGSILGGVLTSYTEKLSIPFFTSGNYEIIFILSVILRIIVILVFLKRFKEVRKVEERSPTMRHLIIYRPVLNFINHIRVISGNFRKKK